MNRTKIEWCDFSWNPIRGLCPEDCKTPDGKSYCYARRMYQRFKWDPKLQLVDSVEADAPLPRQRVFVCSMIELFHPTVPKEWRDYIFYGIEDLPHTFIILTKRPELIDRPMPDNVWLGVSVEGAEDSWRIEKLAGIKARVRFVSLEPFIGTTPRLLSPREFDWLIVGRLTGHGRKHDPEPHALGWLVLQAKKLGIPIFMKDNLKDNWAGPLIQEYPK